MWWLSFGVWCMLIDVCLLTFVGSLVYGFAFCLLVVVRSWRVVACCVIVLCGCWLLVVMRLLFVVTCMLSVGCCVFYRLFFLLCVVCSCLLAVVCSWSDAVCGLSDVVCRCVCCCVRCLCLLLFVVVLFACWRMVCVLFVLLRVV